MSTCRFDDALREADAADDLVRRTGDPSRLARERPFLGVPLSTKDCFAVKGMRWGSKEKFKCQLISNSPMYHSVIF